MAILVSKTTFGRRGRDHLREIRTICIWLTVFYRGFVRQPGKSISKGYDPLRPNKRMTSSLGGTP